MSDDQQQQPAAIVSAREGIVDDTDDHRSVSQIDGRSYYDVSETGRPILHLTTPASPLAAGLSMEPRFVSNTEQLVNQNRTQLWNADNFETDLDQMIQRSVERHLINAEQVQHGAQQLGLHTSKNVVQPVHLLSSHVLTEAITPVGHLSGGDVRLTTSKAAPQMGTVEPPAALATVTVPSSTNTRSNVTSNAKLAPF